MASNSRFKFSINLEVLNANGLQGSSVNDVCMSTVISRLTYAIPAWWGFMNASDRQRLQAVANRAVKWGCYTNGVISIEEICNKLEMTLFRKIINDKTHVLYPLLPPVKENTYNLRPRSHNRMILAKDKYADKNFINRRIYHDCIVTA